MMDRDVLMLNERERRVLDLSFQPGLSEKRLRNIIINAFLVLAALVLFLAYGIGAMWLTGIAVVILLVSAIEKVTYTRAMMDYKAVVRKLVLRLEEVEGTPQTALGSHPAAQVEQRLSSHPGTSERHDAYSEAQQEL